MELLILLSIIAVNSAAPALNRDPMINEGLFEGDILGRDPNSDRNAVPNNGRLWLRGVVPYYITPELERDRYTIQKVMWHIEAQSCVRFVERTPSHKDYLKIFKGDGCYSYIGRIGGEQKLSLGDFCGDFAVILHEMLHAIGFEHEHNRSDRDDYVIINWENIVEEYLYAFQKLRPDQNLILTEFDYKSIMLYGSKAFTKDPNKYSIIRKDGKIIPEVYNRDSMSVLDARRINLLYKCRRDTS